MGNKFRKTPSFHYWQKSPASEIDLVISTKGMVIPVEIKYSTVMDKKCLHAIDMFKEKHRGKGLKIPFSLIIYRGDFIAPRKTSFVSLCGHCVKGKGGKGGQACKHAFKYLTKCLTAFCPFKLSENLDHRLSLPPLIKPHSMGGA